MKVSNPLAWRFLRWMAALSLLLSILSAAVQWSLEYGKREADLQRSLDLVATSYLPSLQSSLWNFDTEQANIQLQGILRLPHLAHVSLDLTTGEKLRLGQCPPQTRCLLRSYPLRHDQILLGTLEVKASLEDVYTQLKRQAIQDFLGTSLVTFFIAMALFVLFQQVVARRLEKLAAYTQELGPDQLALASPPGLEGPEDELTALARTLQTMRQRLLDDLERRKRSEAEILELNQDLSKAKEHADAANAVKTHFLQRMSHEFRTPLHQVLLSCDVLEDELGEDYPESKGDVQRIRKVAQGLSEQMTDLLELVELESTSPKPIVQIIQAEAIAQALLDQALPWANARSNALQVDLSGVPQGLSGHQEGIFKVLVKLLNNACRFTHQGEIQVDAAIEGQEVVFSVRDTGRGISPEQLERVFEAFSQGSEGLTRTHDGLGLGLTLAQHLAQRMNGRISVSSAVGEGSVFRLHLPMKGSYPTMS